MLLLINIAISILLGAAAVAVLMAIVLPFFE
jgi:hypothetical protein